MAKSLSYSQSRTLRLLRTADPRGDPKSAEVTGGGTWADDYTVWVNHQTALALERRGLVEIDKQMDGWDLRLIDGEAPAKYDYEGAEAKRRERHREAFGAPHIDGDPHG